MSEATNLVLQGTSYFVTSKNIHVYPCGRRGFNGESNFDPESRGFTERNLTDTYRNGEKDSYIIDIIKDSEVVVLKLCIHGYYFEITLTTADWATLTTGATKYTFVNISTTTVEMLVDAVNSSTNETYETEMLSSIISNTEVLDSKIPTTNTYIFTALCFDTATGQTYSLNLNDNQSFLLGTLVNGAVGHGSIINKSITYPDNTAIVGSTTNGDYSICYGNNNNGMSFDNVLLFGKGLIATKDNQVIFGSYNEHPTEDDDTEDDTIFAIGDGTADNATHNVLTLSPDKISLQQIEVTNLNDNTNIALTIGDRVSSNANETTINTTGLKAPKTTSFNTKNFTVNETKIEYGALEDENSEDIKSFTYTKDTSLVAKLSGDQILSAKENELLFGKAGTGVLKVTNTDFKADSTNATLKSTTVSDLTVTNILTANTDKVTIKKAATFDEAVTLAKNLSVTGTSTLTGAVTLGSTVAIAGNLTVATDALTVDTSGNVANKGNLSTTGNFTLTGNATVGGTLSVTGASTLTGATEVKSTLTVAGKTTLNDELTVTKGVGLASGLTVGGALTANSGATITGALSVSSNASIAGDLQVNGNINSGTAATTSSDIRLKTNINDFVNTKSILDLPIKTFEYINDESHRTYLGCIAQDLQELYPELVVEGPDGYLAIQETKLIYLLIDEVKKLRDKLNG